jgi:hypothetical protein
MIEIIEIIISSIITFFIAGLVFINILIITNNILIAAIIGPIISVPISVIIGVISYYLLIIFRNLINYVLIFQ